MNIGGLGYIGSHTSLELLKDGFNVIIVDNLSNSYEGTLEKIRLLASEYCHSEGRNMPQLIFHKADYRSSEMRNILQKYSYSEQSNGLNGSRANATSRISRISGIIHFAAYKSVVESIRSPLSYYQNNVCGLVDLLALLQDFNITNFILSSSATVYGSKCLSGKPLSEEDLVHQDEPNTSTTTTPGATGHQSPYGRSKYFSEAILADVAHADPSFWKIVALRYFNPVGCHSSGLLGEDPRQTPTNLFPVITQTLLGSRPVVEMYGSDWETEDGTAIRDFIHVVDLAKGHVAALRATLNRSIEPPFRAFNLGSGRGSSVREVIASVEEAASRTIPVRLAGRRSGDVGYCVAATERANRELRWQTERSLQDSARDGWNFICKSAGSGGRGRGLSSV